MTPLAAAAGSDFSRFDPAVLVAAVNALLPLGKEGALQAIERHLAAADRSADPQHGLFLVLRLLFEVPADPGFHPPVGIGIPQAVEPRDPRSLPYFPLLVVADVPLLLVTTFLLGGSPQPVEDHVRHFRESGTLRGAPLEPELGEGVESLLGRAARLYREAYGDEPPPGLLDLLEHQLRRLPADA